MFAILGIAMVIAACVLVKLFDKKIREKQYRKAIVNVLMIGGLLLTITGIIYLLVK